MNFLDFSVSGMCNGGNLLWEALGSEAVSLDLLKDTTRQEMVVILP